MGTADRFKYLLNRYLNGNLTAAQRREFFDLTASGLYDDLLNASFDGETQDYDVEEPGSINPAASAAILENILSAGKDAQLSGKRQNGGKKRFFFLAAAAILILTFAVSLYFYRLSAANNRLATESVAGNPVKRTSAGNSTVALTLADGSRVILRPGATVFYTAAAFSTSRSVYLNGEAVFYIVRDPTHPFYVYHNNIVTRVLGTSFKINTNANGNIEVEVYTGKVKVYENQKSVGGSAARPGIIITPNYKAIYRAGPRSFQTGLADNPQPIADNENRKQGVSAAPVSFVYANTKVAAVLKDLETGYGIRITVKNDDINTCVFTGDITSESLFDKLKVLCMAINAKYEVDGADITIKGSGCN